MKKYLKAINWKILLAVVLLFSLAFSPMAIAAAYQAIITVNNLGGTAYSYPPCAVTMNNSALVDGGYTYISYLDVDIKTSNNVSVAMMPTNNRTWFVPPTVAANSKPDFYWTCGNSPRESHKIIVGTGGYITTSDDATHEPSDCFALTISLYIPDEDWNFGGKEDALRFDYNHTTDVLTITIGTYATPDLALTATDIAPGEHVIKIRSDYTFSGGSSNTTLAIATGANDNGIESMADVATWYNNLAYLRLGRRYDNDIEFDNQLRYTNVTIPQGATITNAVLTFTGYMAGWGYGPFDALAYCEDVDNSTVVTSKLDLESRTLTTAYGNMATILNGVYSNTNFTAAIQEVVDRDGWASGNALSVILKTTPTNTRMATVYAYEGNTSYAPTLYIEYGTTEVTDIIVDLYVDDMITPKDSDTMASGIPDNANDWIWYPNPYFNYVILETAN